MQCGGFTSFCKNEGTDLLIFFRCSGSENKDGDGDGMDETKEWSIGKQRIQIGNSFVCKRIHNGKDPAFVLPLLMRLMSAVGSCLASCPVKKQRKKTIIPQIDPHICTI